MSVFTKACEKLEKLLEKRTLDGNKASHRIAIGTLITDFDEDTERATAMLEKVKTYVKRKEKC